VTRVVAERAYKTPKLGGVPMLEKGDGGKELTQEVGSNSSQRNADECLSK